MLAFKNDISHAVDVLGDMLCNSKYERYHVELEKETIWQELQSTNDDSFETLMENVMPSPPTESTNCNTGCEMLPTKSGR